MECCWGEVGWEGGVGWACEAGCEFVCAGVAERGRRVGRRGRGD